MHGNAFRNFSPPTTVMQYNEYMCLSENWVGSKRGIGTVTGTGIGIGKSPEVYLKWQLTKLQPKKESRVLGLTWNLS